MKKTILILFFAFGLITFSQAQRYITKNGQISFFSDGALEKIEAHNNQVNALLDTKTGDFVFKVLMKSFVFEKALMQEHFNENYVESDKFPNATFMGKVTGVSDFTQPGTYPATVKGKLTIHGVTKEVEETGEFTITGEDITGKSTFSIKLADYDISIPGAVTGKIAEDIEITADVKLAPMNP